jgi:hypothetical protein
MPQPQIMKKGFSDPSPTVMAIDPAPNYLAVDGQAIYWSTIDGYVFKVAK